MLLLLPTNASITSGGGPKLFIRNGYLDPIRCQKVIVCWAGTKQAQLRTLTHSVRVLLTVGSKLTDSSLHCFLTQQTVFEHWENSLTKANYKFRTRAQKPSTTNQTCRSGIGCRLPYIWPQRLRGERSLWSLPSVGVHRMQPTPELPVSTNRPVSAKVPW